MIVITFGWGGGWGGVLGETIFLIEGKVNINVKVTTCYTLQALLKFDGSLTCGGTVVRNDNDTMLIITSASCVDGYISP